MATFGEIKTRVSNRVIDLPQVVQNEVPSLVNYAYRKVMEKHSFKVMETTAAFVTVAGQRLLGAVPANFKELRSEPFMREDEGAVKQMITAPDEITVRMAFDEDEEGWPQVIIESEPSDLGVRNWEVWPLPDGASDYTDLEYRVYVPYYRYLPALENDGDTNWFTQNAEEYIVMRAQAEAFGTDWDEERMTMWLQRSETEFRDVVMKDKQSRLAGVKTLVPHWQGANAVRLRR
jgi:hypothetical protein